MSYWLRGNVESPGQCFRLRGLGVAALSYYDLLAQADLQNCDPRDSACVSNNVAKQAAVEDLWVNRFITTGAPAGTVLTFNPQTQAQVNEFYNPTNVSGGNVVDTRGIMQVSVPAPIPPAVVIPPAPVPVAAKVPTVVTTPTTSTSGVQMPPGTSSAAGAAASSSLVIAGFDLASIPWWGWLAGAGAAVFAFKGRKH